MIDIVEIERLLSPVLERVELDSYKKFHKFDSYASLKQFKFKVLNAESTLNEKMTHIKNDSFKKVFSDNKEKMLGIYKKISRALNSRWDYEKLEALDIEEVLEAAGANRNSKQRLLCPNDHAKDVQIKIYKNNICKCHNCGEVMGGPISVALWKTCGITKNPTKEQREQACEWLSNIFGVDKIYEGTGSGLITEIDETLKVVKPRKAHNLEYISFDGTRPYVTIANVEDYKEKYPSMTEEQQFKMIATSIYRFSLTTKQWGKDKYFKSIGINKKNKLLTEKIAMIDSYLGFLFITDIPELIKHLQELFPKEDLVKYGVIHDENHYFANQFKIDVKDGIVVVPNFDLYTNMCTGLKFRKTKLRTRNDKKTNEIIVDSIKEPEFSYGRIANPLPYHLTRIAMLDKSISFRFFEGQKDLHSMPSKRGVCDIAIPGINGIKEEMLGLFSGRNVELYFDQDTAGQEGAQKLKELLEKAGAKVKIKKWDISLGGDVNDVLRNGNILKIK